MQKALSNICDKALLAFGAYDGNKYRRNYDEEIEKLKDCMELLASLVRSIHSGDIFWMECSKENKSVKGGMLNMKLFESRVTEMFMMSISYWM